MADIGDAELEVEHALLGFGAVEFGVAVDVRDDRDFGTIYIALEIAGHACANDRVALVIHDIDGGLRALLALAFTGKEDPVVGHRYLEVSALVVTGRYVSIHFRIGISAKRVGVCSPVLYNRLDVVSCGCVRRLRFYRKSSGGPKIVLGYRRPGLSRSPEFFDRCGTDDAFFRVGFVLF